MVRTTQVLAHPCNIGYEQLSNHLVYRVNGEKCTSLKQLVHAVKTTTSRYLRFDLEPHNELVVLETAQLAAATSELLNSHQIPSDRSADLLEPTGSAGTSRQAGSKADGPAAGSDVTDEAQLGSEDTSKEKARPKRKRAV